MFVTNEIFIITLIVLTYTVDVLRRGASDTIKMDAL